MTCHCSPLGCVCGALVELTPESVRAMVESVAARVPDWATKTPDPVNRPAHYTAGKVEAIDTQVAAAVLRSSGALWSFIRSCMSQGASQQQDLAGGKYATYEDYARRVDIAAIERERELIAILGTKNA